jgi:hypothetical protein
VTHRYDVCGSVHRSAILTEKPNKMQQHIKILLFLIINAQHVLGDTPSIIRSLKLHWQPLVLHNTVEGCQTCSSRMLSGSVSTLHDNVQQPSTVLCKTRGCQCSFRFLMMGCVLPETYWASFKIRNNKILICCCIFLGFSVRNDTSTVKNLHAYKTVIRSQMYRSVITFLISFSVLDT